MLLNRLEIWGTLNNEETEKIRVKSLNRFTDSQKRVSDQMERIRNAMGRTTSTLK